MKLTSLSLLSALALSTCAPAPVFAWDIADMNRTIEATNVSVNDQCSGTLLLGDIKKRALVLTAAHCVAAQYGTLEKEVVGEDGSITKKKFRFLKDSKISQTFGDRTVSYDVATKAVDKSVDLALLEVTNFSGFFHPIALACTAPRRGDTVYVVGNPMGHYGSVTKGIVSSVTRKYQDLQGMGEEGERKKPLMQVSAGVVGGNSGGAVYNEQGNLVGVPVIAYRSNEVLGFTVPLESIREFLGKNDVTIECRD